MRKLLTISAALTLVLLMGACINMNVATTVNEDGSGTWRFGLSFDDAIMGGAGDFDLTSEGAFAESETITDDETGITFTASVEEDEDGTPWTYITAEIPDLETWALVADGFTNISEETTTDDMTGGAVDATELQDSLILPPSVTIEDGMITVTYSGNSPVEIMAAQEGDTDDMAMMGLEMDDLFALTYEVTLPGEVTDTNGELDPETNTVTWEVDWTSEDPIEFYATAEVE